MVAPSSHQGVTVRREERDERREQARRDDEGDPRRLSLADSLLEDSSPEVQRQARASLVAIAGKDAGGDGAGAPQRWRAFWKAQLGVDIP